MSEDGRFCSVGWPARFGQDGGRHDRQMAALSPGIEAAAYGPLGGDPGSGNLLEQWDNLPARKALLPCHAGPLGLTCSRPTWQPRTFGRGRPGGPSSCPRMLPGKNTGFPRVPCGYLVQGID